MAEGAIEFPWRALVRDLKIVIERAADGAAVAWFPEPLDPIVTHPSGRRWAARKANHLYLLRLEGAEEESRKAER